MTRCQRNIALLFTILSALLVAPVDSLAQRAPQRRSEVITVPTGVYFIGNPCALDGSGEDVMLAGGSIELIYDRQGRLLGVQYHEVFGVGTVSGLEYAVIYEEEHRYSGRRERFASRLVVTGGDSVFTDEYSGLVGSLNRTYSCT